MKKAYSWREITEMGFQVTDYEFPTEPGIVNATLVMKRWGNNNLVCYFEGDEGEKFKLCAWWSQYENRAYRPRDSDIDFTEVELHRQLASVPRYLGYDLSQCVVPEKPYPLVLRDDFEVMLLDWTYEVDALHERMYEDVIPSYEER